MSPENIAAVVGAVVIVGSIALTGWHLYLNAERGRIVGDIRTLKLWKDEFLAADAARWLEAAKTVWTKAEQGSFEQKINDELHGLNGKLDRVLAILAAKGAGGAA